MADERGIAIARVTGVVQGSMLRYRRDGATPDDVVAEVREITTDPDLLAEAASVLHVPHPSATESERVLVHDWVDLLRRAGADEAAFERYCAARRERLASRPFSLLAFADLMNRTPGQPG